MHVCEKILLSRVAGWRPGIAKSTVLLGPRALIQTTTTYRPQNLGFLGDRESMMDRSSLPSLGGEREKERECVSSVSHVALWQLPKRGRESGLLFPVDQLGLFYCVFPAGSDSLRLYVTISLWLPASVATHVSDASRLLGPTHQKLEPQGGLPCFCAFTPAPWQLAATTGGDNRFPE